MGNAANKMKNRRIRHCRRKFQVGKAFSLIGREDFKKLMQISRHSVLGRMTAIEVAFCLGYDAGGKGILERNGGHFRKGGVSI